MKIVMVCKSGSTFRPRSDVSKSSSRGEQGETEGIIRHLQARGDCRVVYFGTYSGEEICEVLRPDLSFIRAHTDMPASCPPEAQEAGFDADEATARTLSDQIVAMINVTGYSPTMSFVGNPRGSTVQAAAMNYAAPMLSLLNRLKIPRACVVTDPRCYPRDQEMSLGWPYCRPRALLDQNVKEGVREQTIGGVRHLVKNRYAKCESWGCLERLEQLPFARVPSTCVAHAHVSTGIRKSKWEPWRVVLHDVPENFELWGEGWEERDEHYIKGPCPASQVMSVLARGVCCPMVEHTPWFATGKPYVVRAAGSIPIPYGDDPSEFGTYDPLGRLLPLNSPLRVTHHNSLRAVAERLTEEGSVREEMLAYWSHVLKPDWTILDSLVDDALAGKPWHRDGWYGGYTQL